MDKDESATNRVQEILEEMRDNLKFTKTGRKGQEMMIHIRGMDALTSNVERRVGPFTRRICRLGDLRPNFGNTLATTLSKVLSKEDAGKIAEEGVLRVGCVNCKVERRIILIRCFRCWSYSHKVNECNSELDRSKCCYKCGEKGHTAKTCNKEEACPVCGEAGHMADTRKCRVFRMALQEAREDERRENGDVRPVRSPEAGIGRVVDSEDLVNRLELRRPGEGPGLESHPSATQTS